MTWAESPGQTLAGEGLNEAVGLKGNPSGVWYSKRIRMTTYDYDHGSYWEGEESAKWIAKRLGVFKPSSRKLNLQPQTGTSEIRGVGERKMPERKDPKARSLLF